jgi:hypothetical protein
MEVVDLGEIESVVRQGATIRARLLDGFETAPAPVYWVHYHDGLLRFGRAGLAEALHDYQIAGVVSLGPDIIFHTTGETSVAALMLTPSQRAEVLQLLHQWRRVVAGSDRYPEEGWRFGG